MLLAFSVYLCIHFVSPATSRITEEQKRDICVTFPVSSAASTAASTFVDLFC